MNAKEKRKDRLDLARKFLGGKCVKCGTAENLEFDHIDPKLKETELIRLVNRPLDKFWDEVVKCQLLCKTHHIEKTREDMGWRIHGTNGNYSSGCRCDECKNAHALYMREYRARWRVV